ncbi:hypothetical protein ADK91_03005 [Streptomyces sp. XY511]|nr:hypothetical protein ADK91_03005 [Streptomyces sp. XY511]
MEFLTSQSRGTGVRAAGSEQVFSTQLPDDGFADSVRGELSESDQIRVEVKCEFVGKTLAWTSRTAPGEALPFSFLRGEGSPGPGEVRM